MEQVDKDRLSDDDDDDDSWTEVLTCYRMLIVERIQYTAYISAALQSVKVLDREDDEELNNHFLHRTSKMRTNCLVDILLRKGKENYEKFLQVIGIFHPDVYREITGNEPPDAATFPFLPGSTGVTDNQELTQLLMQALEAMKQKAFDNAKMSSKNAHLAEERAKEIDRLKQNNEDLALKVSRYETVDSEMVALRSENDRLKNENYTICMRIIDINEENRQLRVTTNTLSNEKDKLMLDLQKAKRSMDLETSKSVRLRHKLDTSPSERDIMAMRREIDELKLKLAKANNNNQEKIRDEDTRLQILKKDKEEALDMYAEAVDNLHKLRENCACAEMQRDKYLEEREQLTLTCTVLQSDCDMYKMRRDTMWQELQEVEKEREMLMKERNEAQLNTKICMEEKARYRAQIRELEKKYDEMSQKYHESERELIRVQQRARGPNPTDSRWESSDFTKIPNSYPSSTSSPQATSIKELEPEPGQFRSRAYVTKYYPKYASKSKEILDNIVEDLGQGIATVFPEIALASDFPKRKRRLAQNRRNHTESSIGESVSSSVCEDET